MGKESPNQSSRNAFVNKINRKFVVVAAKKGVGNQVKSSVNPAVVINPKMSTCVCVILLLTLSSTEDLAPGLIYLSLASGCLIEANFGFFQQDFDRILDDVF